MSTPVEIVIRSTRKYLAQQMDEIVDLLEMSESNILDYCMGTIFGTLISREKIVKNMPLTNYLDIAEQEKLAHICVRIIDSSEEFIGSRRNIYAMKILALLVGQFSTHGTQPTLKMIYTLLVKILKSEGNNKYRLKLKGLSAHCLNQINIRQNLSPLEAHNLITDSILPLAVSCLAWETKYKKSTLEVFEDNFHDLSVSYGCDVLQKESFLIYPLVIRLLLSLMNYSAQSGGYRKEFESMLDAARKTSNIKDEHIVALNVIIAETRYEDSSEMIAHLDEISTDLLVKSEGLHRAHIAYMTCEIFKIFPGHDEMYKRMFAKTMIDDLITKNDELLVELALYSLEQLQQCNTDWMECVTGKAIIIMKKLLEINPGPEMTSMFLERFDCYVDPMLSAEFDELTRTPILYNINKLDYLINVKERDNEQTDQLEQHLSCLAQLLRLRRHRLEQAEEIKLNKLFDSLINAGLKTLCHEPVYLLVFANSYQVYPSAWLAIIKSLRLKNARPRFKHIKTMSLYIINPITMSRMLSHSLMVDGNNFHARFGSLEILELIYDHCKLTNQDCKHSKCLIKEILLTWPENCEKTRLYYTEFRIMLNKFIQLLISELAQMNENHPNLTTSEWMNLGYVTGAERDYFVDLLSALVVAFCFHRETLYDVMVSYFDCTPENRKSWIRDNILEWTRHIIDHENYSDAFAMERFTHIDLASVVIAYEGFKMINEEFKEFPEFKESPAALLKFIKISCDIGIQKAPIDSNVSERYQQIKASLPEA